VKPGLARGRFERALRRRVARRSSSTKKTGRPSTAW
jgi:hypothetical protein